MNLGTQNKDGLPYGVLFDMDGVLVDSEVFICRAACMMFEESGLKVRPEDFLPFVGTGENRYLGGVAEKYGFAIEINEAKERTYDIYLEIIRGNKGTIRFQGSAGTRQPRMQRLQGKACPRNSIGD